LLTPVSEEDSEIERTLSGHNNTASTDSTTFAPAFSMGEMDPNEKGHQFTDGPIDYLGSGTRQNYTLPSRYDVEHFCDSFLKGDDCGVVRDEGMEYDEVEKELMCETNADQVCPCPYHHSPESCYGNVTVPQSHHHAEAAVSEVVEPCPQPHQMHEEIVHEMEEQYYQDNEDAAQAFTQEEFNAELRQLQLVFEDDQGVEYLGPRAKAVMQEMMTRPCLAQDVIDQMEHDITEKAMPPDFLDACHLISIGIYKARIAAGTIQDKKNLFEAIATLSDVSVAPTTELTVTQLNEYKGACQDPKVPTHKTLCIQAEQLANYMDQATDGASDYKMTSDDVEQGQSGEGEAMLTDGADKVNPVQAIAYATAYEGQDPQSATHEVHARTGANPEAPTTGEMTEPTPTEAMQQAQQGAAGPAVQQERNDEAKAQKENQEHNDSFNRCRQSIVESFATHHTDNLRRKARRRLKETERRLLGEKESPDATPADRRVLSRRQLGVVNAEVSSARRALEAVSGGQITGDDVLMFWSNDLLEMQDIQHYAECMRTFRDEVHRKAERLQELVDTQSHGIPAGIVQHVSHKSEDQMDHFFALSANLTQIADGLDLVVDAFQYELDKAKNVTMASPAATTGPYGAGSRSQAATGYLDKPIVVGGDGTDGTKLAPTSGTPYANAIADTFDDPNWLDMVARVTTAVLNKPTEGVHESLAVCYEGFAEVYGAQGSGESSGASEQDEDLEEQLHLDWEALTVSCPIDAAGCVPADCLKEQPDVIEYPPPSGGEQPKNSALESVQHHHRGRKLLIEHTLNWRRLEPDTVTSLVDVEGDLTDPNMMLNHVDANMMRGVSPFQTDSQGFRDKMREVADAGNKRRKANEAMMKANIDHPGSKLAEAEAAKVDALMKGVSNEMTGSCNPDDHCDPGQSASTIDDHALDQMWNHLDKTHTGLLHLQIPTDFDCDSLPESALTMCDDNEDDGCLDNVVEQLDYGHICREKKHEQKLMRDVYQTVEDGIECAARMKTVDTLRRKICSHWESTGADVHPELRRLAKLPDTFLDGSGRRLLSQMDPDNSTYTTHGKHYGVQALDDDELRADLHDLLCTHEEHGGAVGSENHYEFYDPPAPSTPCHESGVAVEDLKLLLGFPLEEEERKMILDAMHSYKHVVKVVRANVTRGATAVSYNGTNFEPYEALTPILWMMGGGDSASTHNASHAVQELACKEGSGHFYDVCCGIPTYYDIDYIHNHTTFNGDTGFGATNQDFTQGTPGGFNSEDQPMDIDWDGFEDRHELAYCMNEAQHRYMELSPHFFSTLRDIENGQASFDELLESHSPCGATNQTCSHECTDSLETINTGVCYGACHSVLENGADGDCTVNECEKLFECGDPTKIQKAHADDGVRRRRLAKERRRMEVVERRRKLSETAAASCMTIDGKEFCKVEEAVDPVQRRLDELEILGYKYALRVNTVPFAKRKLGVLAKNRRAVRERFFGDSGVQRMSNGVRKSHRGVKQGLRRMLKNGRKMGRRGRSGKRGRN
jgi:hypothetical protein